MKYVMDDLSVMTKALEILAPGDWFGVKGSDDITWDSIEWNDIPTITEEELNTKMNEIRTNFTNTLYQKYRASEYPSIGDQMDMIYKDNKNGTTTHADAVEAIKTKYPKG